MKGAIPFCLYTRKVWLSELDEMPLCNIYLLSHENLSIIDYFFMSSTVRYGRVSRE